MPDSDYSAIPFPIRLQAYTQLLATGWSTYIEALLPRMFGETYPRSQQAEIMLNAIGIGARRWTKNAKAKPPRPLSPKKQVERWQALGHDECDHVGMLMTDSLASLVQQQLAASVELIEFDSDTRTVLVPLQISGLRAGTAQAFALTFPASTTLATLDGILRENLPADITWWNVDQNVPGLLPKLGSA